MVSDNDVDVSLRAPASRGLDSIATTANDEAIARAAGTLEIQDATRILNDPDPSNHSGIEDAKALAKSAIRLGYDFSLMASSIVDDTDSRERWQVSAVGNDVGVPLRSPASQGQESEKNMCRRSRRIMEGNIVPAKGYDSDDSQTYDDDDDDDDDQSVGSVCSESSHIHGGFDMKRDMQGELMMDFFNNNPTAGVTYTDTYTNGDRWVLYFQGSDFVGEMYGSRFTLEYNEDGPPVYLPNTSQKRVDPGTTYAFKPKGSSIWKFCMLNKFVYLHDDKDDFAQILVHDGSLIDGIPSIFKLDSWEEQLERLVEMEAPLKDYHFVMLNQIAGKPPAGGVVSPETRCSIDNGAQCLSDGPDQWPTFKKGSCFVNSRYNGGVSLDKHNITEADTGRRNHLVRNNQHNRRVKGRRGLIKSSLPSVDSNASEEDQQNMKGVQAWAAKSPNKIPNLEHYDLMLVVKLPDDTDLSPVETTAIPEADRKMLYIPHYGDAVNASSITQRFIPTTKKSCRKAMKDNNLTGIDLADVDEVLSKHAATSAIKTLLSSDKIKPPSVLPDGKTYEGCVRSFVGPTSPPVDATFQCHRFPGLNLKIYSKFVQSREHTEYIPHSTGLFQHTCHKIKVPSRVVTLIEKAVGKGGNYPSRDTCVRTIPMWDVAVKTVSLSRVSQKAPLLEVSAGSYTDKTTTMLTGPSC